VGDLCEDEVKYTPQEGSVSKMEGIIIMVVLFIISSIFNASKKKDPKPMPPFNNKPTTQRFDSPKQDEKRKAPRSLEDFANEVFQQLNDHSQTKPQSRPFESHPTVLNEQEIKANEVKTKPVEQKTRAVFDESRSTSRSSAITKPIISDKINENEIGSFVPTTRNALVQAIVSSEIIGPPKAKQRQFSSK
jgi:hypothetical protein